MKTEKSSRPSQKEVSMFSPGPAILSAHRSDDLIKVDEVINAGITSLEVDIYVGIRDGKPTCLIGHEDATATGQTLEQYFENLNHKMSDFTSLWLDCKDLNADNEDLFHASLEKMDSLYAIKDRVLVESRYPESLSGFQQQGWKVSYYCNWSDLVDKTPAEQEAVMDTMYSELVSHGIDGISYDATVDAVMKTYFPTKIINGQPIKMYAWDLSLYFGEPDLDKKLAEYGHLSILLITFLSQEANLVDGVNFKIVSALANEPSKVMDVNGNPPANGEDVMLQSYDYPTTSNQVWNLQKLDGGYYALKNMADMIKALDVRGGSAADGTSVQVYTFGNTPAQRWKIDYVGNGYYNLMPECAPGKNLDVQGGNTANNTPLQINTANSDNSQKFKLVKQ